MSEFLAEDFVAQMATMPVRVTGHVPVPHAVPRHNGEHDYAFSSGGEKAQTQLMQLFNKTALSELRLREVVSSNKEGNPLWLSLQRLLD